MPRGTRGAQVGSFLQQTVSLEAIGETSVLMTHVLGRLQPFFDYH